MTVTLRAAIKEAMYEREINLLNDIACGKTGNSFSGFSLCHKKLNLLDAFEEIRDERQFKALTGVSCEEFEKIIPVFSECYEKSAQEAYENGERRRRPGGGRKGGLKTMKDKLFFILFYLKNYPTFDVLGYEFGLDRSKACVNVHKISKVLLDSLFELGVLPKREFSSAEEMAEAFENTKKIFVDATERLHFRHKDYEKQEKHFSGKHKDHMVKNTVISDICKTILFLGYTVSGSRHDYGLLKEEFPPSENWFENFNLWVDLGYLGIKKDYKAACINIPHKKPRKSKLNPNPSLTKEQKEENRRISKVRVIVENAIGGMKRFVILTARFRNKIIGFVDDAAILAAGLWNLKLLCAKK